MKILAQDLLIFSITILIFSTNREWNVNHLGSSIIELSLLSSGVALVVLCKYCISISCANYQLDLMALFVLGVKCDYISESACVHTIKAGIKLTFKSALKKQK